MKHLLHIIASPRGEQSNSLRIAKAFTEKVRKQYPECTIDTLDLFTEDLPEVTQAVTQGKSHLMSGQTPADSVAQAWQPIEEQIQRFLQADYYLISTPMWNFGPSYPLKHYIDVIVQPKYLFRYTQSGPEGLLKKPVLIISTRGGDYSPESPFHPFDNLEPYLKTVFTFIGASDLRFIHAQPMDMSGPEVAEEKIQAAIAEVEKIPI